MSTVVVAGASGFLGSALRERLRQQGHHVRQLVRGRPTAADQVQWDPSGPLDPTTLRGAVAIVNLGGAGLGRWPWTTSYRRTILASRTTGSSTLARAVAELAAQGEAPRLLQGSAVGFYGSRGDELLDEDSSGGAGFLAGVCRAWEDSVRVAEDAGAPVVRVRTGIVLAASGGAAAPLTRMIKLGLGGRFGDGRQWWPWVSLRDHVSAMVHLVGSDLTGPVNVTSPQPSRNHDLVRGLAHALHRPALLPAPARAAPGARRPGRRDAAGVPAGGAHPAGRRRLPVGRRRPGRRGAVRRRAHVTVQRDRLTWSIYSYLGLWGWFLYSFGPSVPLIRDEQGTSRAVAGLHGTALAVGALVAAALTVPVTRRLGRRRTCCSGRASWSSGWRCSSQGGGRRGPSPPAPSWAPAARSGSTPRARSCRCTTTRPDRPPSARRTAWEQGSASSPPIALGASIGLGLTWRGSLALAIPLALLAFALVATSPGRPALLGGPPPAAEDAGRLPLRFWPALGLLMSCVAVEFCTTTGPATCSTNAPACPHGWEPPSRSVVIVGMAVGVGRWPRG